MESSKFHFYSFGKIAANKPRNTTLAEVFPIEKFTMSAGEITDNTEEIEIKGKNANNQDYEGKIETKPSITCEWLPTGTPNRITAPDVRRGEQVLIYRYADTQYYFWTTAFNDVLKKLETVSYWFSGTPKDGDEAETEKTIDNGYVFEISTHDGYVYLSTSKQNNEKARYTFQFDTRNGIFSLHDDLGNEIELNSVEGILTATTENEVIVNTKHYTLNCKTSTINCENHTVNASKGVLHDTPKVRHSKRLSVGSGADFGSSISVNGRGSFSSGPYT